MSIAAAYTSKVSVVQTLEGEFVSESDDTVTVDGLTRTLALTASTTPPVTKQSSGELTMSSGSGTINLAALPGLTAEETVVGTGLKVQLLKFCNKSTNANKITVAKGASNGYGLCASGDTWSIVLSPDQEVLFYLDDAAPDIAAGARTIDVTGTGSQVLQYHVVMG